MNREQKIKKIKILREKEKRACESSYYEFFIRAFKELEPQTNFIDNWHIKYLCDEVEAEIRRIGRGDPKDYDLDINIPPRSAKSYIFSILLCPWAWIHFPHLRFISASHSKELSIEHCVEGRRLITTEWYQRNWGHVFQLSSDQNVKSHYKNNRGGARFATSVRGSVTGHGADVITTDDLMDPSSANSEAERLFANDYNSKTLFSRLNNQEVGLRMNIQQRLHQEDPSGINQTKHKDKYRAIVIPAELDMDVIQPKALQKYYSEDGLFFPKRFTRKMLDEAKSMGELEYYTQFGQRPSTPGGTIIQRDWFRYYRTLPPKIDAWFMSIDATFKGKTQGQKKSNEPDYAVIQVWAKSGADCYLVDQLRRQMGFNETIDAIKSMVLKHPKCRTKFIEDKANGPAIIDTLKGQIPGITPFNPDKFGDKEARCKAVTPNIKSGNVYLPLPELQNWVLKFLDECTMFPNAKNDDQVDAMVQFLLNVYESYVDRLKKLLGKT